MMKVPKVVLFLPLGLCAAIGIYQAAGVYPALGSAIVVPLSQFWDGVRTHQDGDYLYIESNGMPSHNMMVGIRSWQQQVPLPQLYQGDNAWEIPLHPKLSDHPISARTGLYRGAIAIAINGIPIFNALNNRGEDAYLAGELDKWGGHAGRADDYHYHIAPLFLQKSPDQPIAFALDGFPLFGLTEPDGSPVKKLDEFNGHFDDQGNYHYHATKTYPYINGGLRGVVHVSGGQIDPQPNAIPTRPDLPPLRGATVTGFKTTGPRSYSLEYSLNGLTHRVDYEFDEHGHYTFHFVDPNGTTRTENYTHSEPPPTDPPQNSPSPVFTGWDRQPWIKVHLKELDSNSDGTLMWTELTTAAKKAFNLDDNNGNGNLEFDEYRINNHPAAMAGYITQHAQEIDGDGDGTITKSELLTEAHHIFGKTDTNSDGKITPEEFAQLQPPHRDEANVPR
ncbi:hypothetical protein IAD21_03546 [Abditibacteriota bacterium]|nr:hypothetical protein IAD21_03546 [Abditibacteriota bacterium]